MCPASLSTTPFSLQWATMAFDVPFLQPTNGPIISYAMQGMSYDTPIPENSGCSQYLMGQAVERLQFACNGFLHGPDEQPYRSPLFAGTKFPQDCSCLLRFYPAAVGIVACPAIDTCMAWVLQAFQADVMIAEMFTPCSALLAHTLDLPWINLWPAAPMEPFPTSLWAGSNRRLSQPNSSQLLSPVQEQRGWPHNAIPGSDPVLLRPSRMTAWKSSCRHLSYEVHGLPIKCCDSARRAFIPDSSLALTSSRRHLSCQVQAPHINVIILPGATGNVTALHWSCRACGKEWRMLWCTGCGLGETGASTALLSGTYSELHLTYA